MENGPFIVYLLKMGGFAMAMLNNQMVYISHGSTGSLSPVEIVKNPRFSRWNNTSNDGIYGGWASEIRITS